MNKHFTPPGRPVQPTYKKAFELRFFHAFTIKEKLKILLGYRARMVILAASEHSPGALHAEMKLKLTTDLQPITPQEDRP